MPSTVAAHVPTLVKRRPNAVPAASTAVDVVRRHAPDRSIAIAMAECPERDALIERLQPLGWHMIVAEDGPGAIHLIDMRQPALILLDLCLPLINGLDVLRQAEKRVPAILISDFVSPGVRAGAAAVGALSFLLQPVTVDALVDQVQQILSRLPGNPPGTEEIHDCSRDGLNVETDPGDARLGRADRAGEFGSLARLGAHA